MNHYSNDAIEQMRQILRDADIRIHGIEALPMDIAQHRILEILASPQGDEQEPVAWLYQHPNMGQNVQMTRHEPYGAWTVSPLYTHPYPSALQAKIEQGAMVAQVGDAVCHISTCWQDKCKTDQVCQLALAINRDRKVYMPEFNASSFDMDGNKTDKWTVRRFTTIGICETSEVWAKHIAKALDFYAEHHIRESLKSKDQP